MLEKVPEQEKEGEDKNNTALNVSVFIENLLEIY